MTMTYGMCPEYPEVWCAGALCRFVSAGPSRSVEIPLLAHGWTMDRRRWAVDSNRRLWMSTEHQTTELFLVSREV